MQERRNYIANALELRRPCTNPSICLVPSNIYIYIVVKQFVNISEFLVRYDFGRYWWFVTVIRDHVTLELYISQTQRNLYAWSCSPNSLSTITHLSAMLVSIVSGKGLLRGDTKPLLVPMFTDYQLTKHEHILVVYSLSKIKFKCIFIQIPLAKMRLNVPSTKRQQIYLGTNALINACFQIDGSKRKAAKYCL